MTRHAVPPDFGRDVRCILGLPFDVVTLAGAEHQIRQAANEERRYFLSTPNLNFAVQCVDDHQFRHSVLQSDLSVADGWPLVLVGRMIGAGVPERVAGATLFESLCSTPKAPVKVYFFGGPDGVAARACERVNASARGVRCVGYQAPGYGSVEQMSTEDVIRDINSTKPDFVVVSLGAKKSQEWIMRNRSRMTAPVVSNLGAVVNFAAGVVRRAPGWVQRARLEWMWRIQQEPVLWRRYVRDGFAFLRILLVKVIPLSLHMRMHAPSVDDLANARLDVEQLSEALFLRLVGPWTLHNVEPLRAALRRSANDSRPLVIDLSALTYADGAVLGTLSLAHGWCHVKGKHWWILGITSRIRRLFRLASADYLLQPMMPNQRRPEGLAPHAA